MQLQVRRVEVVVVCTAVDLRSLGSLWFWFDDFPRKGSDRARRRSSGRGRLPHLPNSCCHSFLLKKSTPWQSRRCPKSKFLAVERGKVLPRRPKSTLSKVRRCQKKKKVKILRESDSIGRASQRPWTRLDECPDPVGSRPAPDTFPDPSPESDSSRFARSLNLPIDLLSLPSYHYSSLVYSDTVLLSALVNYLKTRYHTPYLPRNALHISKVSVFSLCQADAVVDDLFVDLRDGRNLFLLLELFTGEKLVSLLYFFLANQESETTVILEILVSK